VPVSIVFLDDPLRRLMVPAGFAFQMIVELSRQHPLRQRLLQLVEQTVLCKQLLRVTTSQKLVQNVLVDCHIDGPLPFHPMASRTKFLTVPSAPVVKGEIDHVLRYRI
jgi:hypothetical protein